MNHAPFRFPVSASLTLAVALAGLLDAREGRAFAPARPAPTPTVTATPKPTPTPAKTVTPTPTPTATATPPPVSTTRKHHLGEVAQKLATMTESAYMAIQKKWIGSTEAACNYFVTTALCEDGQCTKSVPELLAADFDRYLLGLGWKQVSLAELKSMFATNADFDVIGQRDPIQSSHGHVLVPIGLSAKGLVMVAEGELDGVSHEVVTESDNYMLTYEGGLHFFIWE